MKKNPQFELEELEQTAKERFIENCDWEAVLGMLDADEREQYNKLHNEVYGSD